MRVSFVGVWVYVSMPTSLTFLAFFMSWTVYELDRCVCERCFSWTSKGRFGQGVVCERSGFLFSLHYALIKRSPDYLGAIVFCFARAP